MMVTTNQIMDAIDRWLDGVGPFGPSYNEWNDEWESFLSTLSWESIESLLPILDDCSLAGQPQKISNEYFYAILDVLVTMGESDPAAFFDFANASLSNPDRLPFVIQAAYRIDSIKGRDWLTRHCKSLEDPNGLFRDALDEIPDTGDDSSQESNNNWSR